MTCEQVKRKMRQARYGHVPLCMRLVKDVLTLEGRCSGIPDCCIAWFCDGWMERYLDVNRIAEREVALAKIPLGLGYIPCPRCLASQTFVKLRECPKDAQGECACAAAFEALLDFPAHVRPDALALLQRQIFGRKVSA